MKSIALIVAITIGTCPMCLGQLEESIDSKHSLGNLPQFFKKKFAVSLTNNFNEALQIVELKTSCSCTTIEPQSKIIPKHSIFEIQTTLYSQSKLGELNSLIKVKTVGENSGIVRVFRFFLTANIISLYSVVPQVLDFGNCRPSEGLQKTVVITKGAYKDWNQLHATSQDVDLSVNKISHEKWLITAGIKSSNLRVGIIRGNVNLTLLKDGIAVADQIKIPVHVNIESPFTVSPPSVYLGSISRGRKNAVPIRVTMNSGQKFTIRQAEENSDGVTLSKQGDKYFVIYETVAPREGALAGKLILEINSNNETMQFSLPYLGYVVD